MLAITYTKIMKIKVAEWGTPKKYLKKKTVRNSLTVKSLVFKLSRSTVSIETMSNIKN